MEDKIIAHLNAPGELEKLYRSNKLSFSQAFNTLYPSLKGNPLAEYWNERLNYQNDPMNWGNRKELIFVIIASAVAGLIAKLPTIFSISEDFFYPRNIGFIIFPALSAYFAWKGNLSPGKIISMALAMLFGLVFINFLPDLEKSDTLILSCVHMVLFLWFVLGFAFAGKAINSPEKRLGFLRYNGDVVVITTLILGAGGILTAMTIGLFSAIGMEIEDFYFEYFGIFGISAAPLLGTYLTQTNPHLVGKVSPVIAQIFSPLVLIMLVIYLLAILYTGKDPYNNREFLMIFNGLLIGVLAVIFFSVAETFNTPKSRMEIWVLLLLSVVTVIVNGIALSAILFRISEWGITPNRAAVLGGNLLILVHLLLVTAQLLRVTTKRAQIAGVGKAIAFYLPVYFIWSIVVTFLFPFLFGFE